MAKKEGIRRIVMVGKLIVSMGITLAVLSFLITFKLAEIFLNPSVLIGGSIALHVTAFGGLVWAAGWIAEGFAEPDA